MRNIVLMLVLLVAPYLALGLFNVPADLRGRIGVTCVFVLTGLGHFIQARGMSAMIPRQIPERWRLPIIYGTGVMELAGAVAVLPPPWARTTGILLCVFLILVLPSNVDAAVRRVPFGGHSAGPVYLLARVPLQALLIAWIYWFAVRAGR